MAGWHHQIDGHGFALTLGVGDGAGKAGNIVTAAATGLVAARDILKNSK